MSAAMCGSYGEKLWVASRVREQPLANSQQNGGAFHDTVIKDKLCHQLNEFESGSFPNQAFEWEHSPANTLIAVFWDTELRNQIDDPQTPDPWKLWDNKCALFKLPTLL